TAQQLSAAYKTVHAYARTHCRSVEEFAEVTRTERTPPGFPSTWAGRPLSRHTNAPALPTMIWSSRSAGMLCRSPGDIVPAYWARPSATTRTQHFAVTSKSTVNVAERTAAGTAGGG